MRNIIITAAASALLVSCAQAPKYQLTGHLDNLNCDKMIVQVYNENFIERDYTDTICTPNGDIAYSLRNPNEARQILLMKLPNEGERPGDSGYINMMLLPGEQAILGGTWEEETITGSQFYLDEADYKFSIAEFTKQIETLQAEVTEISKNHTVGDELDEEGQAAMAKIYEKYNVIAEEGKKVSDQWVLGHSDSDYAAYLAAGDEELLSALTDRVRTGVMATYIKARQEINAKNMAREENAKRIAEGSPAPDFTLLQPDGEPLSLNELQGKVLVIDFWGSWCHWCIKGIPDMKEAYEKHSGKLEIISIACSDSDEAWRKALAEQQMPWRQVINGTGDNDVSNLYGVSGYPTKVIVDAEGIIIKVVVGENPEFYTILDELCK